MPIKILENNERVAEVQFICDCCGKIVQTSPTCTRRLGSAIQQNSKMLAMQTSKIGN